MKPLTDKQLRDIRRGKYNGLVKRLADNLEEARSELSLRNEVNRQVLVTLEPNGQVAVYGTGIDVELVHLPECEEGLRRQIMEWLLPCGWPHWWDYRHCQGLGNVNDCLRLKELMWNLENDPTYSFLKGET